MNCFRILHLTVLIWGTVYFTIYSQSNLVQNITAAPSASNFTYPQSVFVDSPNGNIWVTDFDNNRVLRFDVSSLTDAIELHTSSLPTQYSLGQNFPNPFNSMTQIKFSTNLSGNVELVVYNILGKKVATLFNNNVTANTVYLITFDAKLLSSGIYFYSLITEQGSSVKRMCLLK